MFKQIERMKKWQQMLTVNFRHGWKKLYIVVSSRKIIMFNSEQDRQNSDPTLILDLNKVVTWTFVMAMQINS